MKRNILLWETTGVFVIFLSGFIFHFAFFWLKQYKPLALIFAVNESVWEHCKIGFWPALLFSLGEYFFIRKTSSNFFLAKGVLLLTIPLTIITLFYTYTGVLGKNFLFIDISIFLLAVLFGQYLSYKILTLKPLPVLYNYLGFLVVFVLLVLFSTLTYYPLDIPLFIDKNSGQAGLPK